MDFRRLYPPKHRESSRNLGYVVENFELLEAAVDERDGFLVFIRKWPNFDVVRDDPRFTAVLDRIGFPK